MIRLSYPNRSLWVPVSVNNSIKPFSVILYTNSQSGAIWHSWCPIKSPIKEWSLFFSGNFSPFTHLFKFNYNFISNVRSLLVVFTANFCNLSCFLVTYSTTYHYCSRLLSAPFIFLVQNLLIWCKSVSKILIVICFWCSVYILLFIYSCMICNH